MQLAILVLAAALSAADIPNASFESPGADQADQPAGWHASFPQGAEHVWDDQVAHSGSHSARVSGLDPDTMDSHVSAWRHRIDAPGPGRWYLTVWVKGQGLKGPGSVRVLLVADQNEVVQNAGFTTREGDFDWYPLLCPLDLGPEVKQLEFVFGLVRTAGTIWFDDLSLRAAADVEAGRGKVAWEPAGPFVCGSDQELKVTYTVGGDGIAPGGGIRLEIPSWREQRYWGRLEGLKVECSRAGVELKMGSGERTTTWPPQVVGGLFTATTAKDGPALLENDRLTATWQVQVATVDTEAATARLLADTSGSGQFLPAGDPCTWQPSGGPAAKLVISATCTPAPNEDARLNVAAFDAEDNPSQSFTGDITLGVEGGTADVPASLTIGPDDRGFKRVVVHFPTPGVYHVTARSAGIEGRSHAIWVREGRENARIYFGDLHVHGEKSGDAVGPQDYHHRFARDYLGLDFSAISDHAPGSTTWAAWDPTKATNNRFRTPPWYETIQGYERSFRNGHKNVYFPDDDPPFYGGKDSTDLWGLLGGREALTIPHTPNTDSGGAKDAQGRKVWETMDWGPKNEQYQRVVELVQTRSSYEQDAIDPALRVKQGNHGKSVQDALAMGHTMGFIGSTDVHSGRPGSVQGRAAVVAPRLERRALWTALDNRSCYAVSGERILIELTLNDQPMGSVMTVPTAATPREIRARVVGTGKLQRLDLIRGGKVFSTAAPDADQAEFRAYDEEPLAGRTYYYLRVIQEDTHMAWTSPVWVSVQG